MRGLAERGDLHLPGLAGVQAHRRPSREDRLRGLTVVERDRGTARRRGAGSASIGPGFDRATGAMLPPGPAETVGLPDVATPSPARSKKDPRW
jgi:hypothetical protein